MELLALWPNLNTWPGYFRTALAEFIHPLVAMSALDRVRLSRAGEPRHEILRLALDHPHSAVRYTATRAAVTEIDESIRDTLRRMLFRCSVARSPDGSPRTRL